MEDFLSGARDKLTELLVDLSRQTGATPEVIILGTGATGA
jgi:hypothetical protein